MGPTVTKKTDYVVVGEDAGSKAERATALKRPVLDEADFLALLAQAEAEDSAGGRRQASTEDGV